MQTINEILSRISSIKSSRTQATPIEVMDWALDVIPELCDMVEALKSECNEMGKEYDHCLRLSEDADKQILMLKKALERACIDVASEEQPDDAGLDLEGYYIQRAREEMEK